MLKRKKESMIDKDKHLILKAPHPSPSHHIEASLGLKPFSQTNYYLVKKGKKPIRWINMNIAIVGASGAVGPNDQPHRGEEFSIFHA